MKTYNITASIVLFNNNKTEVKKAISSFLNTELNILLYLVDNSPTDNLKDLVTDERIIYIPSHDNPGFGSAHNKAIKKSVELGTKYHLILNPDVEFKSGVLEELYSFMENNMDIGNVMPKVTYKNGELQKLCNLLPTPLNLFGRRFASSLKSVKSLNEKYELADFNYDNIVDIPNLSGCFMLIRSAILKQIGGFDERFFMYLEDVDLNRRIADVSRTVFYPYVTIIHHYEKGSYKSSKLLKYHIKSAIKYFNKWGWILDSKRSSNNKKTLVEIQRFNLSKPDEK